MITIIPRSFVAVFLALVCLACPVWAGKPRPEAAPQRPALTVLLVVDQLRDEHVNKFRPFFLAADGSLPAVHAANEVPHRIGGFNYLLTRGSQHRLCVYNTLPTHTAAGHALIATGAPPCDNGIISNSWLDRTTKKNINAVRDDNTKLVGVPVAGDGKRPHSYSPRQLIGSTIGDELQLATNGLSQVYSVSLKNRAAILLGGKSSDLSLWFDISTGCWVSSTWYLPQGKLPAWVEQKNQKQWCDQQFEWTWERFLPQDAYYLCAPDGFPDYQAAQAKGMTFSSKIKGQATAPNEDYRFNFTASPLGITETLDMAATVLKEAKLGQDCVPDLLTINIAPYDYIGHAFGPNSPQTQDALVRLDRDLATFLETIDRQVGLDNTLFVLTADHGCCPAVPYAKSFHLDAGNVSANTMRQTINQALEAKYGAGKNYVLDVSSPHIYLDESQLPAGSMESAGIMAQNALQQLPGVKAVYTREQILSNQLPPNALSSTIANSYNAQRSGELFIILQPFYIASSNKNGGSHGLPYRYDTQVPLIIAGPSIKAGERFRTCHPQDISATICTLLKITLPSGCQGRVLEEDF